MHPEDVTEDPLKEWLIKEGARRRSEQYKKKCEHCGAEFKIEESTNPAKYPLFMSRGFRVKGILRMIPFGLLNATYRPRAVTRREINLSAYLEAPMLG